MSPMSLAEDAEPPAQVEWMQAQIASLQEQLAHERAAHAVTQSTLENAVCQFVIAQLAPSDLPIFAFYPERETLNPAQVADLIQQARTSPSELVTVRSLLAATIRDNRALRVLSQDLRNMRLRLEREVNNLHSIIASNQRMDSLRYDTFQSDLAAERRFAMDLANRLNEIHHTAAPNRFEDDEGPDLVYRLICRLREIHHTSAPEPVNEGSTGSGV